MTDETAMRAEASRLARTAQLEDVIYFETTARRQEIVGIAASDVPMPAEVPIQVMIGQNEGSDRLLIRVIVEIASPQATFRVDVGAQFVLAEALLASPEVQIAFASQTAMPVLTPYVRESLMTMASRMRLPAPLLPLVHVGGFTPEDVTVAK